MTKWALRKGARWQKRPKSQGQKGASVLDLFGAALRGDAASIEGVAALVTILAIVPSAILFIVNQLHENNLLRDSRHRYITDKYHYFLEKVIDYPKFRLGSDEPPPPHRLTGDELYQRDILFDLMTSIFEGAFLAYANRIRSYRQRQWKGWDAYLDEFVSRADYREWWLRVIFHGDASFLSQRDDVLNDLNISQYDRRFEAYMLRKLRGYDWEPPAPAQPQAPRKRGRRA